MAWTRGARARRGVAAGAAVGVLLAGAVAGALSGGEEGPAGAAPGRGAPAAPGYVPLAERATLVGTSPVVGDQDGSAAAPAPGPVTGLEASAPTLTGMTLSWTGPAGPSDEVVVRRAAGATPPAGPTDGTGVALPGPAATAVADTGLAEGTVYSYAVFVRSGDAYGAAATLTWSTMPAPVTTVYLAGWYAASITIGWGYRADPGLAGVVVRSARGRTPPATPDAGVGVPVAPATATTATEYGVPGGDHSYAVFTRTAYVLNPTPVVLTVYGP